MPHRSRQPHHIPWSRPRVPSIFPVLGGLQRASELRLRSSNPARTKQGAQEEKRRSTSSNTGTDRTLNNLHMPLRVLERKKLAPQGLVTEGRGVVNLHTGQDRLGHGRSRGELGPVIRAGERDRGLVELRHSGRPARRGLGGEQSEGREHGERGRKWRVGSAMGVVCGKGR